MIPRAFEIDDAAREIAIAYWKDRHFNRIIAIHKYMDDWKMENEDRNFVKHMLRNDILHYLRNAPESLDLPNWFERFIMGWIDLFDNALERIGNLGQAILTI